MKRELAWYPGINSNLNHLYDLRTGKTLCGSPAKRKKTRDLNYWQNSDCPRCKSAEPTLEDCGEYFVDAAKETTP
jgi:hypothetical protein